MAAAPSSVESLFEMWDPRVALALLGRAIRKRARCSRDARSSFMLWPAIPEPALYVVVADERHDAEVCAA